MKVIRKESNIGEIGETKIVLDRGIHGSIDLFYVKTEEEIEEKILWAKEKYNAEFDEIHVVKIVR